MMDKNEMEYFNYKKDNNYRAILERIENEEKGNKSKILKIVATLLITVIGTMGMVFAATQIYNTYIKKNDDIDLKGLFYVEEGEFGSLYSDEITAGMSYEKESNMYYRIIKDEEEYEKIREKVKEFPESTEIDFNNNFLILITHGEVSIPNLHEKDLTISEITADDTTTHIILKTKENPDYNKLRSSMYVIADKTLLRENIKIEKDISSFKIQNNNISIDKLPNNYSKEEALKDGCMVVERFVDSKKNIVGGRVISENKYALEELIENSKKGIESYIRIYLAKKTDSRIIDIQYKNEMFIINDRNLENENIIIDTCKYIVKDQYADGSYMYNESNTEKGHGGKNIFSVNYNY